MTAPTALLYRVPDGPPEVVVAMLSNIEREGAVPLATVALRQRLWASGGHHARLAERLNRTVNEYTGKVVAL